MSNEKKKRSKNVWGNSGLENGTRSMPPRVVGVREKRSPPSPCIVSAEYEMRGKAYHPRSYT